MVTTNSFASDLKVRLSELQGPEEVSFVDQASRMIMGLVESIKPIAKYVDRLTASGDRVIVLGPLPYSKDGNLALNRNGEFGALDERDNFRAEPRVWGEAILEDLVIALRTALEQAEDNKEKHLLAIRSRREMLDKIVDIMKQK